MSAFAIFVAGIAIADRRDQQARTRAAWTCGDTIDASDVDDLERVRVAGNFDVKILGV